MAVTIDGAGPLAGATTLNGLTIPTTGFGKVLQVVTRTTTTQVTSTSSTFVDTGLTATITPSSAASKVLVLVSQQVCMDSNDTGIMTVKIVRNSTDIQTNLYSAFLSLATIVRYTAYNSYIFLDSPNSTTATIYKTQFAMPTANSSTYGFVQRGSGTSVITLIEVAA